MVNSVYIYLNTVKHKFEESSKKSNKKECNPLQIQLIQQYKIYD